MVNAEVIKFLLVYFLTSCLITTRFDNAEKSGKCI